MTICASVAADHGEPRRRQGWLLIRSAVRFPLRFRRPGAAPAGPLPADQWQFRESAVQPRQPGGLLRMGGDGRSRIEELYKALLGVVHGPAGVAVGGDCCPRGAPRLAGAPSIDAKPSTPSRISHRRGPPTPQHLDQPPSTAHLPCRLMSGDRTLRPHSPSGPPAPVIKCSASPAPPMVPKAVVGLNRRWGPTDPPSDRRPGCGPCVRGGWPTR